MLQRNFLLIVFEVLETLRVVAISAAISAAILAAILIAILKLITRLNVRTLQLVLQYLKDIEKET